MMVDAGLFVLLIPLVEFMGWVCIWRSLFAVETSCGEVVALPACLAVGFARLVVGSGACWWEVCCGMEFVSGNREDAAKRLQGYGSPQTI